jgi:hypothetical protein
VASALFQVSVLFMSVIHLLLLQLFELVNLLVVQVGCLYLSVIFKVLSRPTYRDMKAFKALTEKALLTNSALDSSN